MILFVERTDIDLSQCTIFAGTTNSVFLNPYSEYA